MSCFVLQRTFLATFLAPEPGVTESYDGLVTSLASGMCLHLPGVGSGLMLICYLHICSDLVLVRN